MAYAIKMTDIPQHLIDALQGIVSEIFQAGVRVGSEQMRVAILHAAQAPWGEPSNTAQESNAEAVHTSHSPLSRAPRGSVRRAVTAALQAHSSLGELELGQAAARMDPSVSPRSVGGELRRMKDRLYRFDRGQWFLTARESEKEAAGSSLDPADLLNQTTKGVPDAETPIAA